MSKIPTTLVHITAHYPPYIGGMERVVYEIATRLAKDPDYKIQIVTTKIGMNKDSLAEENQPNYKVSRLKSFVVAHTPIMPGLFFRLLCMPRTSVFHVHVAQAGIPEVTILAAKLRRIPVVMHMHCDIGASGPAGVLIPYYKKYFLGWALRRADVVAVATEFHQGYMRDKYNLPTEPVIVSNGVDDCFFVEKPKTDKTSALQVLYVGRLSVEKNVPLLVEAIGLVKERVNLTIVGGGYMREDIEKAIANLPDGDKKIHMAGAIAKADLVKYYTQADVLALPSDYETQPLVILEAFASGTPVIVSDIPTLRETVADSGLCVAKTPEAFAAAISTFARDPKRLQQMRIAARKRGESFKWEKVVATIKGVYSSL